MSREGLPPLLACPLVPAHPLPGTEKGVQPPTQEHPASPGVTVIACVGIGPRASAARSNWHWGDGDPTPALSAQRRGDALLEGTPGQGPRPLAALLPSSTCPPCGCPAGGILVFKIELKNVIRKLIPSRRGVFVEGVCFIKGRR